jgi:hypothetical protein
VGLKNPGAVKIARWSRQEQWAALGVWAMFASDGECRISTEEERRLAIEIGKFLGVGRDFFRVVEGCEVGDQKSGELEVGEEDKDDRSEIDLKMNVLSLIRVLRESVSRGGWQDQN